MSELVKFEETANQIRGSIGQAINLLVDEKDVLTYDRQTGWVQDMCGIIGALTDLSSMTTMQKAVVLWHLKDAWDNGYINSDIKKTLGGDFYALVAKHIDGGMDASLHKDRSTIRNWTTVARDWVIEGNIEHPNVVQIPVYNGNGNPTGEEEYVYFDPMRVRPSKLLIARNAGREGRITDEAWALIVDNRATIQQLKDELKKDGDALPPSDELAFWYSDGILYSTKDGRSTPVAALAVENSDDPLFVEAAKKLLATLGIKIDDLEEPHIVEHGTPLAQRRDDSLILNLGRHKWATFTRDQVKDIIPVAIDLIEDGIDEELTVYRDIEL